MPLINHISFSNFPIKIHQPGLNEGVGIDKIDVSIIANDNKLLAAVDVSNFVDIFYL